MEPNAASPAWSRTQRRLTVEARGDAPGYGPARKVDRTSTGRER